MALSEVISRCAKLEYIDLHAAAFENETLAALARLMNLKILDLSLAAKPLDVDALAKIHFVSHLRLQGARLSKANLDFLSQFENLQFLDLGLQQSLKADELTKLSARKQLRQLWLSSARIGDEELAAVASISQLTFLEMSRSSVTDTGMKHIEKLAALKHLSLPGNRKLTGKTLDYVGKLRALETLDLSATNVDDASLAHLYELRKLIGLAVENTKVTRTGVEGLKTKLPKCAVLRD